MVAEGKLEIEVVWDGESLTSGAIRSGRTLRANRLLVGKRLQDAVDTVPLLFSLCGRAQGIAAVMATGAAVGARESEPVRLLRKRLVLAEMLQEHLWRVLFDWPRYGGREPRPRALAEIRDGIARATRPLLAAGDWKRIGAERFEQMDEAWLAFVHALNELLHKNVFGCAPVRWLELDTPQAFEAWCRETDMPANGFLRSLCEHSRFGASDVTAMPAPDDAWLRLAAEAMHGDPAFAQRPNWNGAALETGVLSRQLQHPLLQLLTATEGNSVFARMVARLIALARLASGQGSAAWGGALSLGNGEGIAWVDTARGLLMHRVISDGERVLDYQIVAPTEWNFHPRGALVRGLQGLPAQSARAVRERVEWLVQSLDPCVPYEIAVRRTGGNDG